MNKRRGQQQQQQQQRQPQSQHASYELVPHRDGKPTSYDPSFRGPVHRRSCTDISFLVIFILFVVGWGAIAFLAIKNGNIQRVINPSDSRGNICGTGENANKPYLFFFDIFKCKPKLEEDEWIPRARCRTPQVCVSGCPTKTFSVAQYQTDPPNVNEIKKHMICVPGTDMSQTLYQLTQGKPASCAYYYIASVNFGGRCFPSPTSVTDEFMVGNTNLTVKSGNEIYSGDELIQKAQRKMSLILNARKYIERIFVDLGNTWKFILVGLVAAMLFALLWIVLMRFVAGLMVWLGILGIITLLAAATTFSWLKYASLKGVPGADAGLGFSRKISYYTGRRQTWLILGIVASVLLFILSFVVIFLRSRIRVAITLIKEAAKAIRYMPTALVFPLFPYLLQLFVFLSWAGIALLLISLPTSDVSDVFSPDTSSSNGSLSYFEKCIKDLGGYSVFNNQSCIIGDKALGSHVSYTHIYNFFGLLWVTAFIVAYGEMTLAAAVASYYWTRQKSDIPTLTVASAMWTSTRYHLGTLAFGSLIIAIVSFIRAVIEAIERKLKQYDNEITKAIICCCRCFCWCLENFLRFVNRNAYIMCAVHGKNFCSSARRSFSLLMRNIVRVVVVDKVTDFLLLSSKLVVVGTISAGSYYVFSGSDERFNQHIPELNYPLFPVLLIAVGSYAIATCFFDVYNMAVDTLFLCFLEDCERHDGSKEKPYFMSKELMLILKKKNVKPSSDPSAPTSE